MRLSIVVTIVLIAGVRQTASGAVRTVDSIYRGLSSGPLRQARLVTLPEETLLRSGARRVTRQQVSAEIAKAPLAVRTQLKRN